jgi:hypothetical protein
MGLGNGPGPCPRREQPGGATVRCARSLFVTTRPPLTGRSPWTFRGTASRHYVLSTISFDIGSLAAIADTIDLTAEMAATNARSDAAVEAVVAPARRAGVLRGDMTVVDLALLIEQLARSPAQSSSTDKGGPT